MNRVRCQFDHTSRKIGHTMREMDRTSRETGRTFREMGRSSNKEMVRTWKCVVPPNRMYRTSGELGRTG